MSPNYPREMAPSQPMMRDMMDQMGQGNQPAQSNQTPDNQPDQDDEAYEEDGTLASGYAEDGPYHCGDCVHFREDVCTHPVVVNDPALEARKRGDTIPVDAERGCCRFVRPAEQRPPGPVSEEGPEEEEEGEEEPEEEEPEEEE